MRRRNFIKKIAAGSGASFVLQGVPMHLLAEQKPLSRLSSASKNDRVLVILQMHGGNDGINTFVPLDNYDLYYNRRANIALPYKSGNRTIIPLDSTLPDNKLLGLHPDMTEFKRLYDLGIANIIQGVSYQNNNGSHFRGRDIWFMGGNSDEYFTSGWAGRYLNSEFAPLNYPEDFPNNDMPDPLALEMGNEVSLLFHQDEGIPTALALGNNPTNTANLIEQLEGYTDENIDPRGLPPGFLNGTPYGREMDWILGLEEKSENYIKRLQEIYERASETRVEYPENYPLNGRRNPLSGQLKLVARLLDGGGEGVKTKVFLLKIGGFDTHAQQVESYDPTLGGHAALLYHISTAMAAFQRDLSNRGLSNRVLTVTMSEFGRRIGSNGSYGTDHGTGGAVMLFGRNVNPGVFGNNPDLNENNVGMQYDYRNVYASILRDWLEVDEATIQNDIFFGNYLNTDLKLVTEKILGEDTFYTERYAVDNIYPNPASDYIYVKYRYNAPHTATITLTDVNGKELYRKAVKNQQGSNKEKIHVNDLATGTYFVKFESEMLKRTQKLIIK
jgi:uncharacterized protein (DUF1501 family)